MTIRPMVVVRAVLLSALAGAAALAAAEPANLWSTADFDGDSIVDLAGVSVREEGGTFHAGRARMFRPGRDSGFAHTRLIPNVRLSLRALDVDDDQDLDLVLRETFTNRRLAVWLNSGHGQFTRAYLPDADAAEAPGPEVGSQVRVLADPQGPASHRTKAPFSIGALRPEGYVRPTLACAACAPLALHGRRDASSCRGPPSPARS